MIRRVLGSVYRFLTGFLIWKNYPEKARRHSHKMSTINDVPIGVKVLKTCAECTCPQLRVKYRQRWYRVSVWVLTYIAYMCYHMSRKPISVVKTVLHQDCTNMTNSANDTDKNSSTWCDWAPFNGSDDNASHLLGEIDSAFLFAYAFSMFFSGFVAERVNLRYFLSIGMILSGIFCYLFGIAKTYGIHSFSYFFLVQIGSGIVQTTGWPGVVAVLGNWCDKSKRGIIFGIWNSHTSLGNILGSLIAAEYVEKNWALSFIFPGLIMGVAGFIIFLFLVVSPHDVGCGEHENPSVNSTAKPNRPGGTSGSDTDDVEAHEDEEISFNPSILHSTNFGVQRRVTERSRLLSSPEPKRPEKAIGFIGACKIPGVVEFAMSLFFSKLVSYTFLYWLPLYVQNSTSKGATLSADVSTLFDVGGIFGAILAGVISDQTGMSATTCSIMLFTAIPSMFIYQLFGNISLGFSCFMLLVVGCMVNGPYALITTAVSAELGTHPSLDENSKALATVTAIIDGTGSIGAAVGPLLAGFVKNYGWNQVFYMLMVSNVCALLLLTRLVKNEIVKYRRRPIRIE